jgi:T5SS/PEP-CTERM-associated repeat protein
VTFSLGGNTYTQTAASEVDNASGDTTLKISGGTMAGTSWNVGDNSTTTATVKVAGTGSAWTLSGISAIGDHGNGTVSVSDHGSFTATSRFYLGNYGSGTLEVKDQGTASTGNSDSSYTYLGYRVNRDGTATVDGEGSTWNTNNYLYVGWNGTGTVSITGGGVVTGSHAYIAYNAGSSGQVTVEGEGVNGGHSQWNLYALRIGGQSQTNGGPGTLTVRSGGAVTTGIYSSSYFIIYHTGIVNLEGDSSLSVNSSSLAFDVLGGTVNMSGQNNTITGNATFDSYIDPDNVTTDSTLNITLDDQSTQASQGLLAVSKTLTLGGTLNVLLDSGFKPVKGDSFDLLDWKTLVGTFDTVTLPELSSGLSWYQMDLYNTGVITVVPEPGVLGLLAAGGVLMGLRRRRMD